MRTAAGHRGDSTCEHRGSLPDTSDLGRLVAASAPKSWAVPSLAAFPAFPADPCHNGGSCTDGVNTAYCECLPGFQGTFCEEDINECASDPCRNGANCTDCVDSYTCTCPAGFSGIHCENNTPDCTERCAGLSGGREGDSTAGCAADGSLAPQAGVHPGPVAI
ncbi:hypothetical protein P7K49_002094 [Saguinus oedipus]|uniref:EGF-like domain-containing protein n=1 Tax=Saguinus oedipus TaxID=9490 RepID=A0ABQ9WGF6_SAGOE|nr:hypothetical protein P7K49_002094 [Saguinus oedipus]